jgi:Fur family ferric uptake transcriptional regulator
MSCVETLRRRHLKLTPQRRLIVEVIHTAGGHITAEDIISDVQTRMPGINKSTVYRTLDLLEETGCVVKSEMGNQSVYHHAEEGHHHHLICVQCGGTTACDEALFAAVAELLAERHCFSADFKHTVIHGLCGQCAASTGGEAHSASVTRHATQSTGNVNSSQ